ncbi:phosphatase PAP2 family protein [Pseudonocardia saturnea]
MVAVLLGAVVAGRSTPLPIDQWAQGELATRFPKPVLLAIDYVGEPIGATVAVALVSLVALLAGRIRLAVVAPIALAVTGTTIRAGLKPLVDRTIHGEFLAYPSGHTATATVLGLVIALLLVDVLQPGGWTIALLMPVVVLGAATIMAVGQTAMYAHYFTDTPRRLLCGGSGRGTDRVRRRCRREPPGQGPAQPGSTVDIGR